MTGCGRMLICAVELEVHPVDDSVKKKLAVPCATPVTIPELLTVAMDELLLDHVPPEVGERVVVVPTQILVGPVIFTTGRAVTVSGAEARETQPVDVLVNVKVTVPAAIAVTTPPLVICATAGLELIQVPPVEGVSVVFEPTQIVVGPVY